MNSILPSGLPRYNTANLTDNIKFENQSVIIGEYAGRDIKQAADISKNYFNTFVGYRAGQNSVSVGDTIFLGAQAGMNLYNGSNTIILGREADNGSFVSAYNMLSLGYFNKTETNSISVGSYNTTNGYLSLSAGKYNTATGDNNVTLGNGNQYIGSYNVNIGNKNALSGMQNCICIGNNINDSGILAAGRTGGLTDAIIIGNNLVATSDTLQMNIGNTLLKDAQGIYVGQGTSNVYIGFQQGDETPLTSNMYSLYTKNGLYVADRLAIGGVTLISNSNLATDVEYILPVLPDNVKDTTNVALSLDANNQMIWRRLYQNTDELPQGNANLYYNDARVDARVEAKFHEKFNPYFDIRLYEMTPTITLDRVKNGTSNQMIVNNKFQGNLALTGSLAVAEKLNVNHLIVNKIEVLGYGGNIDTATGTAGLTTAVTDLTNVITNTSNQLVNALNALATRVALLESRLG
jgi:hypothetical protein